MNYEEVEYINYEDELWTLREPHPALADFLVSTDRLIILRHGHAPFKVVLGVPHQAAVGDPHICEHPREKSRSKRRDSDENAASYALVAFTALRRRNIPCKLVIMAHPTTHDPNKETKSPYCEEVLKHETALLFECHGASPKLRVSLEVSAGCNDLSDTIRFGRALATALGYRYPLAVQKEACKEDALIFEVGGGEKEGEKLELAALETDSLVEAKKRWNIPALHLEAKPAFRKPTDGSNTVTPDGLVLGRAIAQAIVEYLSETEPLVGSTMDTLINLPHGGPGAGFHVSELVSHIQSTARDYIIQAQQNCTLKKHTKSQSLDVWLRTGYARNKDTKQAVNKVMDALVATGWFEEVKKLTCPESGRRVKGLRLVDASEPQ